VRILLIDETSSSGAATKRTLDGGSYHLESMLAGPEASERARTGGFDVVLVEWSPTRPYVRELLRALRDHASRTYTYVIVHSDRYTSTVVAAAFASGADDFLRRPYVREELVGRLEHAARLKPLLDASISSLALDASTAGAAWSEAELLAVEALSGMSPVKFRVGDVALPFTPTHAACVLLSRAADQREVQLSIQLDSCGLEALGQQVFASVDPALLADLLLEMTNTAAGAFMRRALDEGMEMTMNLPVSTSPEQLYGERAQAETVKERRLVSADGAISITLAVALRVRANVLVPAAGLIEGMVITRDLLSDTGVLLLKGGTRITASASARMKSLLSAERMVEVADRAA
jgi:CheY-like chemotaxis protein